MLLIENRNRLFLFWKIGKTVFEKHNSEEKIASKISDLYSYRYGMSYTFSIENINNMKKFYLCFPVFCSKNLKLSWKHYLKLIEITDSKERLFYYRISIFLDASVEELQNYCDNFYYERI